MKAVHFDTSVSPHAIWRWTISPVTYPLTIMAKIKVTSIPGPSTAGSSMIAFGVGDRTVAAENAPGLGVGYGRTTNRWLWRTANGIDPVYSQGFGTPLTTPAWGWVGLVWHSDTVCQFISHGTFQATANPFLPTKLPAGMGGLTNLSTVYMGGKFDGWPAYQSFDGEVADAFIMKRLLTSTELPKLLTGRVSPVDIAQQDMIFYVPNLYNFAGSGPANWYGGQTLSIGTIERTSVYVDNTEPDNNFPEF